LKITIYAEHEVKQWGDVRYEINKKRSVSPIMTKICI